MPNLAWHWEGVAGPEDHAECPRLRDEIEAYHFNIGLGSDTAYNKLYCMHGQVFEGKGWGFRDGNGKVCYANGTDQANRDYWAACYMAGPGQSFTPAAQHAAYLLGQEAVALGATDYQPHKTFFNTQCPGPNIEAWLTAGAPDAPTGPVTPPVPSLLEGDDMGSVARVIFPSGAIAVAEVIADGSVRCRGYAPGTGWGAWQVVSGPSRDPALAEATSHHAVFALCLPPTISAGYVNDPNVIQFFAAAEGGGFISGAFAGGVWKTSYVS